MASYSFFPIVSPSGQGVLVNGINATGQIVGQLGSQGLLDSAGVFTIFSDPNGTSTVANGINASGQIVGGYFNNAQFHGFLDSGGSFVTIDDPLGKQGTFPEGINSQGEIVGGYIDNNSAEHGFFRTTAGNYFTIDVPLPTNVTFTEATGINDTDQIVGFYDDNTGEHGFLDSQGQFTTLDDPQANGPTEAFGINNAGQIVGSYEDANNIFHAFIYSNGTFTTIDDPAGGNTNARGINDGGQIIGFSSTRKFRAEMIPPAGATPTFDAGWAGPITREFNGDGFSDLAWQRTSDGVVEVQDLFGTGTIGGGVIANNPFNAAWTVVASADTNGDGIADLVYRRQSDGLVEIQFLNGNNAVGGGAIVNNPFDQSWNIVGTGDFNGDAKGDLVWQNQNSGLVEIQLLNGITPVGGGAIPNSPFGAGWTVAASGDFNGDRKSDLVYQRAADGLVEIQFLNGTTPLGGGVIPNSPFDASWKVVAAGDFDNNGTADLVYQRQSDGLVEIQLLSFNKPSNGLSAIGGGAIPNSPFGAGWQVVGVGDFNGDGHLDLAYRNTTSATTEVQFLNGNTNGLAAIGGGIVAFG